MKNKNVAHLFTAAFLSLLLSFGGISCLVTAFDLKVSLSVLFFCCAACAAGGCLAFSFRRGGAAILCVLALLGGYLWQQGTLYQQCLRLCYNISIIYHRAYGFGWLGSSAAADSVLLPLCVLSGLIALATGGCIYHRRMAPLAVFCSVLPLVLCLVVTDTVPSPLCFFLLLLGLFYFHLL